MAIVVVALGGDTIVELVECEELLEGGGSVDGE